MSLEKINNLTEKIIGAGINVHRELGPGLLESAYTACLFYELTPLGLKLEKEKPLPVVYREVKLDCGYRLDLVVEDLVIIELKAIQKLEDIYHAQLLSYLKLSGHRVGLLMNFHMQYLKEGIKRVIL